MRLVRIIFWALVAVFLLTLVTMFVPVFDVPLPFVVVPALFVIGALGITLLILVARTAMPRKKSRFLLLTGSSAVGLPLFAVLHNVVSGLFGIEEAVFFTLATIISPLGFLIGVIGTITVTIMHKPDVLKS